MPRCSRSAIALGALLLTVLPPTRAQQPTFHDALLDHLAGHWVLQGTVASKKTTHDVDAEWVMAHQYLRIHEVSRELDPGGAPQYEATVYVGWDGPAAQYACVWLDVYGGISSVSIGTAKRAGDSIPFVFKEHEPGEFFHTTFAYRAATGTWDWTLDSDSKGTLSPFARLTLTRAR